MILLWSWNDKWIDFYLEIIDLFNYLLQLEAQTSTCFNNLEGKISECWSVNEEGIFFFLILLVKRAKLLAHDWSSGCLATAYAI